MNSTVIHYGVRPGKLYDVKICFPGGIEVTRSNLKPGQMLLIEEQSGWAKFISLAKRAVLRTLKSRAYHIELAKFAGILIIYIISIIFIQLKQWIEPKFHINLFFIPVIFYLFFEFSLFGINFMTSHVLPITGSILSFIIIFFISRRQMTQAVREGLADELLSSCRVFDHGNWATSYLNQLQLFSMNLSADQPLPEKTGNQLHETITEFYTLVYKKIDHIQQLAFNAMIQVHQSEELRRQLLYLSENLNKIKVALALQKGIPAQIWHDVHRLVDQVKMNIREINFGVSRLFSCDVMAVIQKTVSNFKMEKNIAILLSPSIEIQNDLHVCFKASELVPIIENLFENAERAMINQISPKIKLSYYHTDQYFFLEVQDNGEGIPPKMWAKIFEPTYTTKLDNEGGFGLYYSRTKIEKYGGSIEVSKSTKNKGTTFLIKLKRI